MNIYDYSYVGITGEEMSFEECKGKVMLIVNIASKCGFTPQLDDLEELYKKYKEDGLEIIGFPCNQFALQSPGSNSEMHEFCKRNYGVTFPLSQTIDVLGENQLPLYSYLTKECKFEGFDLEKSNERLLRSVIENEMPENLLGDTVKWNFTKFLVDASGTVIKRYESFVEPMDMERDLKRAILYR